VSADSSHPRFSAQNGRHDRDTKAEKRKVGSSTPPLPTSLTSQKTPEPSSPGFFDSNADSNRHFRHQRHCA
jgi:hypothetical protein